MRTSGLSEGGDTRKGEHRGSSKWVKSAWGAVCAVLIVQPLWAAGDKAAPSGSGGDLLRQLSGLDPEGVQVAVRLLIFVTVVGVVPSIILLTTCFPRIVILLGFLRRALGTQELPPNQVVTGLALILTGMIMVPVWSEVYEKAYRPVVQGEIKDVDTALRVAEAPVKKFMLRQTSEKDLVLMLDLSQSRGGLHSSERPPPSLSDLSVSDLSFSTVLPAFVLSELKIAFQMGFLLYLPFLMIDLVVSAVLLSMGMFMLPPILVSLPLKVLVFVLVDGWHLVVDQLIRSFH